MGPWKGIIMTFLLFGMIIGIMLTSLFVVLSLWVISQNQPKVQQFLTSKISQPAIIVGDDDDTAEVRKAYDEADKNNQDIQII